MNSILALIQKLEAKRTPVNYITAHLTKDQLPPAKKNFSTPLFSATFSFLLRIEKERQKMLQLNKANLWLRALEGKRVVKSKLINKNRDLVIDLLELFCKPNTLIIIGIDPAAELKSAQSFLAHSLLSFLLNCDCLLDKNKDIEKLLAPGLDNCKEISKILGGLSQTKNYGFFYFLGKNPVAAEQKAKELEILKSYLETQGNSYNRFLEEKISDERLRLIAVRKWVKKLEIDPVLRKSLLSAFASNQKIDHARFLFKAIVELLEIYEKEKLFLAKNFLIEDI